MAFSLEDYVDVAERVRLFYEKYPDGRLVTVSTTYKEWASPGILSVAEAYRTSDDPHPAVGTAWEPVPGKTPYTRDSEVQNAETAAWGRAIVAAGIGTKKIASKEEVRNRGAAPKVDEETKRAAAQRSTVDLREGPAAKLVTPAQIKKMFAVARGYALKDDEIKAIIKRVADVDHTKEIPRYLMDAILQEIDREGMGTVSS